MALPYMTLQQGLDLIEGLGYFTDEQIAEWRARDERHFRELAAGPPTSERGAEADGTAGNVQDPGAPRP